MPYKHKCLAVLSILLFTSIELSAQLDTKHWIPPFFAKVEDQSGTSNIRDHFVALSTPSEETIPIAIKNGFGQLIDTVFISKASPQEYTFGPIGNATGNPATAVYPLNVVPRDSLNTPIRSQGLYFESTQPFFVNMRHKAGSQGFSLTSKGQVALGTKFFTGHIYTTYNEQNSGDNVWNNERRSHFVSVMATEDNTTVTFDLIKDPISYIGQNPGEPITVTLNALESYVIGVDHADFDNLSINLANGTRVTSDKPIVTNSGSWLSGNQSGQCIGADQLVPAEVTGQEYILVKGLGDETTERPMIVATGDNTEVFLNDELSPVAVLDEGEFYFIQEEKFTANDNLYILATEKVFVFQTASGSATNIGSTVGLTFIPPLNCAGAKEVNLPFVNSLAGSNGSGRINIITKAGASIFVNDNPSPLSGAQAITGNSQWVTYAFDPPTDNVNIVSDSVMNVALLTRDGVVGSAGYFSGFTPPEPLVEVSSGINGSQPCVPGNAVLQTFGFDTYQWYFDGEEIEGATSSTLIPEFAGEYSVDGIDFTCGLISTSDIVTLPFCQSTLGASKDVINIEETSPASRIFDLTYRIFIENFAATIGTNIQVIENIEGGLPAGATAELIGTPSLAFGILSGGINPSFNGTTDRRLLTGTGSLPGNATDAIDLTIRVDLSNATQDGYFNQITISTVDGGVNDGTSGPFSSQDFSHSGSNPDPNGNGEPNEEGENDPTLTCFFPNTISYSGESFCITDGVQEIEIDGVSSGTFSVDIAGLAIDNETGNITPQNSESGTYTVTFTAEGRCPTVTSTEVTISEDGLVLNCSDDITVNADPGICGAFVSFPSPNTLGSCGTPSVSQTGGLLSGSEFPLGVTTVTFEAMDLDGNSTECSFNIEVLPHDCPDLCLSFGDPCDDGDQTTSNDQVNENCECEGVSGSLTLTANASSFPGGFNLLCNGETTGSIDLSIIGAVGATTISWSGPNGFLSNDEDISSLSAGEYCVTVIDEMDNSGSLCVVLIAPDEIVINFFVEGVSCAENSDGEIFAGISGGVPSYEIEWSGPNGFFFFGSEIISGLEEGSYVVMITDNNGCAESSSTELSITDDPLTANAGIDQAFDGINPTVLGGNPTAAGGSDQYSFSWDNEEFLDDPTSPNPEVTNLDSPVTFQLEVTDLETNCIDQDEVFVDYLVSAHSLDTEPVFSSYPNPFNDALHLISEKVIAEVIFYDALGRIVFQTAPFDKKVQIDGARFEEGLYVFRCTFDDRSTQTLKVCKSE